MNKLLSRKLISIVLTVLLIVMNKRLGLGLDSETIYSIVGAVGLYVVGQGIADAGSQGKKPEVVIAEGESGGPNWDETCPDGDDEKELLG